MADYNYDFFKKINEYKIYQSMLNTTDVSTIGVDKCIFDENDFSPENIDLAQNICKNFKYLYHLINKDEHEMLSNIDNKFEYANYWLNYELEENKKYLHISSEKFYQKLKEKDQTYEENKLQIKIRNVDEVHLDFMKILEKLYINYYGLYNIIILHSIKDKPCAHYSQICHDEYEKAIKDCTNPNSTNFCKALEEYRETHEQLLQMNEFYGKCPSDELKKLTKNEEAIKEEMDRALQSVPGIHPSHPSEAHTGITAVTVIGVSLAVSVSIILLYMFTPFGSWLRHRIKRYIWIYKNSQDEIHNINLNSEEYTITYNSIQ
ncbi:PIR Superfamily Protein [Plasmodium ovale wallikeri]|uniref:PIR Superfamily Protein n=1 Tax=Plasmodium ovale wallikeri TaxID=864142 RepID=A0A1A9APH0_PLAOA|nr:PIR Superfamily Protein [Plasmodium ovale wallikeri]